MTAYYNENDKFAAQWLRNLIDAGEIANGVVDDRSIMDVRPSDLEGYTQCHFFAGIGVWSRALRQGGWPDGSRVWTGSCPCQPFSAAGQGAGVTDERHLWPAWFHLIQHGKPAHTPVFGEQVASKLGLSWLDTVQADMEAAGHAFWPFDLCSAGFGAPHIRQRLYFVSSGLGHSDNAEFEARDTVSIGDEARSKRPAQPSAPVGLGDPFSEGLEGQSRYVERTRRNQTARGPASEAGPPPGRLADSSGGRQQVAVQHGGGVGQEAGQREADVSGGGGASDWASSTNGFWSDADWLFCRDDKWRPVEPGTQPLVDGSAFKLGSGSAFEGKSRVGILKGYGNAINAELAAEFVAAYIEAAGLPKHKEEAKMKIEFSGTMPEMISEMTMFLSEMGLFVSLNDDDMLSAELGPNGETLPDQPAQEAVSVDVETGEIIEEAPVEDKPAKKPKRKPKAKKAETEDSTKTPPAENTPTEESEQEEIVPTLKGAEAKQAAITILMEHYNTVSKEAVKALLKGFDAAKFSEVDDDRGEELLNAANKLAEAA